jgi:hypothetical protein
VERTGAALANAMADQTTAASPRASRITGYGVGSAPCVGLRTLPADDGSRKLGPWTAPALVAGDIVGVGVFMLPVSLALVMPADTVVHSSAAHGVVRRCWSVPSATARLVRAAPHGRRRTAGTTKRIAVAKNC